MVRAIGLALLVCACRAEAPPLRVAAAADLERSLGRVVEAFVATGAPPPTVTYGASGLFAQQLIDGAPFDVFLSASGAFVDRALAAGRCDPNTRRIYAIGQLVLITAPGVEPARVITDLADPRFSKIALANPEHAPYGQAALAALHNGKVFEVVEGRLIRGDNVRQALTYVETGNAEVGLVAASLVVGQARVAPVDPQLYPPLEQVLVVCAPPERAPLAHRFADLVTGPEGQHILQEHGFGRSAGTSNELP